MLLDKKKELLYEELRKKTGINVFMNLTPNGAYFFGVVFPFSGYNSNYPILIEKKI